MKGRSTAKVVKKSRMVKGQRSESVAAEHEFIGKYEGSGESQQARMKWYGRTRAR